MQSSKITSSRNLDKWLLMKMKTAQLHIQCLLFRVYVCFVNGFTFSGIVILIDQFWSFCIDQVILVKCDKAVEWSPRDTEVKSWRPTLMTFWLSLSHQHPLTGTFSWWRALILCTSAGWGSVREKIKHCVCVYIRVCVYVVCLSAGLASRCESPPVAMFYSVSCCSHACHSLSEPAHSNSFKGYCRLHIHHQLLH